MSKRSSLIVIVALVVALVAMLVYLFWSEDLSWESSYRYDDTNPYGTSGLYELLRDSKSKDQFVTVTDSLHLTLNSRDTTERNANYLFVGSYHFANKKDVGALRSFMEQGNSVFLFVDMCDGLLLKDLFSNQDSSGLTGLKWADLATVETEDSVLTMYQNSDFSDSTFVKYIFNFEAVPHSWTAMNSIFFSRDSIYASELGYVKVRKKWTEMFADPIEEDAFIQNDTLVSTRLLCNYLRVPVGKGILYIHTTPLAFTNYNIRQDSLMEYCRQSLSYLRPGKIYWDEENRYYDSELADEDYSSADDKGPLEFILSEPNLRRAWYLMLLTALLYLIFGARRKQRVIPVLAKKENSSIEYAQVISGMFLKQKDHRKLVQLKIDIFKAHLRDRYGLRMPDPNQNQQDFVSQLAMRIRVSEQQLTEIFVHLAVVQTLTTVELDDLLKVHNNLEFLYQKTK